MQRYFADIKNNKVILSSDDEHHVVHVMRNRINDKIEVVNNSTLFLCNIDSIKPLEISVESILEQGKSTNNNVTLFFSLAKGEKIDFVVQKATELGAKNIVLVDLKRCVVKFDQQDFAKKCVRYEKIAKEASEQSHRLDIPNILGVYKINQIPKELLQGHLYVAYEKEKGNTTSFYEETLSLSKDEHVGIIIGPEGGFEPSEIDLLNSLGFKNVSLGNRILRTETAAVYALSVLGFMLER